jgi:hypothetical protein
VSHFEGSASEFNVNLGGFVLYNKIPYMRV